MGKTWPALDIHLPGCDPDLHELLFAELDDFHPTAIQEPDEHPAVRAFFSSSTVRDDARRALQESFGHHVVLEAVDIPDENWAARSQAELKAISVGTLCIAPPWDASPGPATIVIQPSMGFGTGHHATTRLMLRALQELDLRGRTVLDIGCGSGVLAIAAVRLGATHSTGVDNDRDALDSARENVVLNDAGASVDLEHGDFRELHNRADVVLANLTGALLEHSADELAALVAPGGALVVSGFMNSESSVVPAFERLLNVVTVDFEDEWLCCTLEKRGRSLGER